MFINIKNNIINTDYIACIRKIDAIDDRDLDIHNNDGIVIYFGMNEAKPVTIDYVNRRERDDAFNKLSDMLGVHSV